MHVLILKITILMIFTPQTASCGSERWVSNSIKTMHYLRNYDMSLRLSGACSYAGSALFSLKY